MGIAQKLGSKISGVFGKKSAGLFENTPAWGYRKSNQVSNFGIEEYQGSVPWVSICVNKLVNDIKDREYYFTNEKGEEIEMKQVPEAIRLPFENGHNGIPFSELLGAFVANRLLSGNGYLLIAQSTTYGEYSGLNDSFVYFPSDKVKIMISRDGLRLLGYELTLDDGTKKMVPPEMIIHSRRGMIRRFIGVGVVTQLRLSIEGDIAADEYYRSFLTENSKMPLKHINIKDYSGGEEDLRRQKEIMGAKYSDRIMLTPGDVTIVDSNLMSSDFDFLDNRKYGRETVISAFGMNHFVLGLQNGSGNEKSGNQIVIYHSQTVNAELQSLSNDVTNQFVRSRDKKIKWNLRKYTTGDIETVSKSIFCGVLTPNDGAASLGHPVDYKNEAGNSLYLPTNLVPIELAATPFQLLDPTPTEGQTPGKSLAVPEFDISEQTETKSKSRPKAHQIPYLHAAVKSRAIIEDRYTVKMADFFDTQKQRVLAAVTEHYSGKSIKSDKTVELIFDIDSENEVLKQDVRGMHTSGVQRGVSDVSGIAGARVNPNLTNPFVLRAINGLGNKITGTVNETTKTELRALVGKAYEEGWHVQQLQDEIQGKFEQFQGYRARMIARTEARAAWDAGAQVSYTAIGVEIVDIVGCEDNIGNCNRTGVPISQLAGLDFHPNHTGVPVPTEELQLAA